MALTNLSGKTAFITGGAGGIGLGMAEAFRDAGMNVVIADISYEALSAAADKSAAIRREAAVSLRDVPFAQSKNALLALASGFDGRDRTMLEAIGTGAKGKEAELYTALAASSGAALPTHLPYATSVRASSARLILAAVAWCSR